MRKREFGSNGKSEEYEGERAYWVLFRMVFEVPNFPLSKILPLFWEFRWFVAMLQLTCDFPSFSKSTVFQWMNMIRTFCETDFFSSRRVRKTVRWPFIELNERNVRKRFHRKRQRGPCYSSGTTAVVVVTMGPFKRSLCIQ